MIMGCHLVKWKGDIYSLLILHWPPITLLWWWDLGLGFVTTKHSVLYLHSRNLHPVFLELNRREIPASEVNAENLVLTEETRSRQDVSYSAAFTSKT